MFIFIFIIILIILILVFFPNPDKKYKKNTVFYKNYLLPQKIKTFIFYLFC